MLPRCFMTAQRLSSFLIKQAVLIKRVERIGDRVVVAQKSIGIVLAEIVLAEIALAEIVYAK